MGKERLLTYNFVMSWLKDMNLKLLLPVAGGALFLGALAGFYVHGIFDVHTFRNFRETDSGYQYIAPLLFVSIDEDQSFPTYRPLKNAMQEFVDTVKQEGRVEEISVHFRNLNTSQWVAINPDERYAPGSMFKVATLIAALDFIQSDPSLLKLRARIGGTLAKEETQKIYPPENPVTPGNTYTVEELVRRMIQQSDNVANVAVTSFAGEKRIQKVYEELELVPVEDVPEEGYTAQEYSRLYRTLYNSTYLSRTYSEYALNLLASSSFTQGIVAGVPSSVRVAHKFGVRTNVGTSTSGVATNELHDCGIVYYPEQPYFICVMTRGTDFGTLERVLAEASAVVWAGVNRLEENQ